MNIVVETSDEMDQSGINNPAYKHGHAARGAFSPEYHSWASMMTRCYNKKRAVWKYYGGKGVKVCKRWHTFDNFFADMGPRPKGKTLDRINGACDYKPSNCRWATKQEQAANRPKAPITGAYSKKIVSLVKRKARTLPELYARLPLHQEVIKQEVRKLRAVGVLITTRVPGIKNGTTLLCEHNGRNS